MISVICGYNLAKVLTMTIKESLKLYRSLAKTNAGRLTPAGRALVDQGLKAGMARITIAKLLRITPSAVTYHANH